MAKFEVPDDVQIAALQNKKALHVSTNLMAPGEGLPWEDRGSIGFFPAFFKTALGCMFRPVHTLTKIRRPDAAGDARAYSFICAGVWALSVVVHSTFNYFYFYSKLIQPGVDGMFVDISGGTYVFNTLVGTVAAGVGSLIMWLLVSRLYYRMVAFDMKTKSNPLLMSNIMAYLMSPCLIALIPGGFLHKTHDTCWVLPISPMVAVAWMFLLWIVMGIRRLQLHVAATLIASIITFVACAVILMGAFFVGNMLGSNFSPYDVWDASQFEHIPGK